MQITRTTPTVTTPATGAAFTPGGRPQHHTPPRHDAFGRAHTRALDTMPSGGAFSVIPAATGTTDPGARAQPLTLILDGAQRHHLAASPAEGAQGALHRVRQVVADPGQVLDLKV